MPRPSPHRLRLRRLWPLLGLGWTLLQAQPMAAPAAAPQVQALQAEQDGEPARALPIYERELAQALALPPAWREAALLGVLPRYGRALTAAGRLAEAEQVLQQAMAIRLPAPANSPGGAAGGDFGSAMSALRAAFQMAQEGSRGLNQRLLLEGDGQARRDAALGPRLPPSEVPVVLMAELRARQGRADAVRALWRGEFVDWLAAHAPRPGDPQAVLHAFESESACWHLALALQAVAAHEEAGQALRLALDFNRQRLLAVAAQSNALEAQLGGFEQRRWQAASAIGLALASGQPQDQRLALGAIASAKGLANRFTGQRRRLLATLDDARVARAREAVGALERELPRLPVDGEAGLRAWVDWTNAYAAAIGPAMSALGRAGLGSVVADADRLLQQVQAALAPDEALLGFVLWQPLASGATAAPPARYLRYVLSAGGLQLRDLGPRREIDRSVGQWRAAIGQAAPPAVAGSLASTLLDGLPPGALAAPRWVVDPDGLLGLLPLEALPDPAGGAVLERRTLRYLTTLAQLADPAPASTSAPGEALVLADPTYPAGPALGGTLPLRNAQGQAWRDMVFAPLPDTRREGEAVARALQQSGTPARLLTGEQASPDALRGLRSPAVLHVASHGFVLLPTPEGEADARWRMRTLVPGLLAGLALAPGRQGPVLTGSELAGLDLRGTRLVVLSACDTGNGSLDVHEGLTSLRRALEEAGAQASVTSLWPVPSAATADLMGRFYQALAQGQRPAQALRTAKLALRGAGAPAQAWAGFLLAGADR